MILTREDLVEFFKKNVQITLESKVQNGLNATEVSVTVELKVRTNRDTQGNDVWQNVSEQTTWFDIPKE